MFFTCDNSIDKTKKQSIEFQKQQSLAKFCLQLSDFPFSFHLMRHKDNQRDFYRQHIKNIFNASDICCQLFQIVAKLLPKLIDNGLTSKDDLCAKTKTETKMKRENSIAKLLF